MEGYDNYREKEQEIGRGDVQESIISFRIWKI